MKCRIKEIGDSVLEVVLTLKGQNGVCDFSGNAGTVCEVDETRDYFDFLLDAYEESSEGSSFTHCIKGDWNLFPSFTTELTDTFLKELYGEKFIHQKWITRNYGEKENIFKLWNSSIDSLLNKNRFFPPKEFDDLIKLIRPIVGHSAFITKKNLEYFRARICPSFDAKSLFTSSEMGAPPKEKVFDGRSNPAGIPHLYIASSPETAVSEIRPHPSDYVAVSKVSVNDKLKLGNFYNPRAWVSPFLFESPEEVSHASVTLNFMEDIFSNPVLPQKGILRYLPTQYLSEAMKNEGYDGIVYKSSVSQGYNLTIFNPANATISNPSFYHIKEVSYKYEKMQLSP